MDACIVVLLFISWVNGPGSRVAGESTGDDDAAVANGFREREFDRSEHQRPDSRKLTMAVIGWWGGEDRVAQNIWWQHKEAMLTSPMVVRDSSTLTWMRWSDHVGEIEMQLKELMMLRESEEAEDWEGDGGVLLVEAGQAQADWLRR